jgi:ankyrin repeat protein
MSVILDFDIPSVEGQHSCDQLNLHDACEQGNLDRIRASLERSISLDTLNASGWSPLHLAAHFGRQTAVRLLLEHGARPNTRSAHPGTCDGCTPLHVAVLQGRTAITQLLIQGGASVNDRDEAGYTPLHLATSIGHLGLVKTLLIAGADINPIVGDETPLTLARRARRMQIAALLRQCGGTR